MDGDESAGDQQREREGGGAVNAETMSSDVKRRPLGAGPVESQGLPPVLPDIALGDDGRPHAAGERAQARVSRVWGCPARGGHGATAVEECWRRSGTGGRPDEPELGRTLPVSGCSVCVLYQG